MIVIPYSRENFSLYLQNTNNSNIKSGLRVNELLIANALAQHASLKKEVLSNFIH